MSTPNQPLRIRSDGTLTNTVFFHDPQVNALMTVLNREGEEARIVGGAVRNALIGLPPGDIDVATTATPETVVARAKAERMRVIPTGIAHGTVTVMVAGSAFEVTTLREDVETDGRHAVVRFGRNFAQDAMRRDFTINALSVDAAGRVHDFTGGLDDLAARRVRFIGDAAARIREDYLRILRFFRFSAAFAAGPLDPEGLAASAAAADHLGRLSRERIRVEMMKLLAAPRAPAVVAAMHEAGVLSAILGDPCFPDRHDRLAAIEVARGEAADPLLAVASIGLKTSADAGRLRERLRLSNAERDRLLCLASLLESRTRGVDVPDPLDLAGWLFTAGRQCTVDAVTLAHAESGAPADAVAWQQAFRQAGTTPVPNLPVSGADVMARGIRSGPVVGAVLKHLQARWIRAGFPSQPAVLHRLLDEAIGDARSGST